MIDTLRLLRHYAVQDWGDSPWILDPDTGARCGTVTESVIVLRVQNSAA